MLKFFTTAFLGCAMALTSLPPAAQAQSPSGGQAASTATQASRSGRLDINGVDYYYELHGHGEPLLLLHGGLGSIDMFGPALTQLAHTRQVIAVDLQGHGRTPLGSRPFSLEAIGADMAVLVQRLGREQVDVLGYSLGGGVALQMALQQPQRVRRLAMVSVAYSDEGYYPELKAQQVMLTGQMAPMMKDTPMYQSYAAVAPDKGEFPRLLDTLGDFMRSKYDVSAQVPSLKMPVMLVYGDGDMFRPEHVIRFYQLLGGGLRDAGWQRETLSQNRLAILPNLTHYDIFASPRLVDTVLPFLDGNVREKSWAEQVRATQ